MVIHETTRESRYSRYSRYSFAIILLIVSLLAILAQCILRRALHVHDSRNVTTSASHVAEESASDHGRDWRNRNESDRLASPEERAEERDAMRSDPEEPSAWLLQLTAIATNSNLAQPHLNLRSLERYILLLLIAYHNERQYGKNKSRMAVCMKYRWHVPSRSLIRGILYAIDFLTGRYG